MSAFFDRIVEAAGSLNLCSLIGHTSRWLVDESHMTKAERQRGKSIYGCRRCLASNDPKRVLFRYGTTTEPCDDYQSHFPPTMRAQATLDTWAKKTSSIKERPYGPIKLVAVDGDPEIERRSR